MHAAVFVDFENLFASLRNRDELTGQRTRDLCVSILENLKARLQAEGGPMVLGRSYAAFDTYPSSEVAHDLALMGFDPQYVLLGHSGRNSAEVQLAIDVCRVLFRRPDIEEIVIVSGDRDCIPLARQVLEENRELRVVAIPDTTSGDLRMRVGAERFWNALELIPPELRAPGERVCPLPRPGVATRRDESVGVVVPETGAVPLSYEPPGSSPLTAAPPAPHAASVAAERAARARAAIVGHIPVTWRTGVDTGEEPASERLLQCLDLIVKAHVRHGNREVWLSPFLKGPMSQHFSGLVHPERRALINELRNRGVIRVEERENQFAEHPYSVIVIDETHPLAQAALERQRRA
jgi:hypothetical protein